MIRGNLLLGLVLLSSLTSCALWPGLWEDPPQPPDLENIPPLRLNQVWQVDQVSPGSVPMSLFGSTLLVPLGGKTLGLAAIDVRDGTTLWRWEGFFRPESNAVIYGDKVFCIGYFAGDSRNVSMVWLDTQGHYQGRVIIESPGYAGPRFSRIHLVGDAIYWGDGFAGPDDRSSNFWRFNVAAAFEPLGDGRYKGDYGVLFHPQIEGVAACAGDVFLGVGEDVVFTYYNIFGILPREEPQNVIRMKPTGEVVWDYPTKAARQFGDRDLLLVGDKILVSGSTGTELIDAASPNTVAPVWARESPDNYWVGYGLVAGGYYFGLSLESDHAINAYSMATGKRLWVLPNTTSVAQGPQFYNGKLFVSEGEGVLVVDAKKGQWIGRDEKHKGYTAQVNVTFAYENLFIHFSDRNGTGLVEALDMSRYE